jgi:phytoene synthase
LAVAVDDAAAREHARTVTQASGTSFFWAMRLLPPVKRDAMFAVYAYCREIDDIADDPAPTAEKRARLAAWRQEIDRLYAGKPTYLTAKALLGPVRDFDLQRQDFLDLIDGMEMDATEAMRGPPMRELELYCDRVAGAVGMLSIRVFGCSHQRARDLARALGRALQLTNILRDMAEDAERERLYLPAELLDKHGIAARDADAVLAHPNLPKVCEELAGIAQGYFDAAIDALRDCDRKLMRPAVVMMWVYRNILARLIARGWTRIDEPVSLPKVQKLWIAFRYGVL